MEDTNTQDIIMEDMVTITELIIMEDMVTITEHIIMVVTNKKADTKVEITKDIMVMPTDKLKAKNYDYPIILNNFDEIIH